MQITTKKELKVTIFLYFLMFISSYSILIFNGDSLMVLAQAFQEVGSIVGISFIFFMGFTLLLCMDLNSFLSIKLSERKEKK